MDFYKQRIEHFLREDLGENPDELMVELTSHEKMEMEQESFAQKRGQFVIGRHEEMKQMKSFLKPSLNDGVEKKVLMVLAEPGNGKSSLMANYVLKLKEVCRFVFHILSRFKFLRLY